MERLTIKELAPYLAYGLKVRNGVDYTLIGIMPYRTIRKHNGEDEFRLIVKSEDDAMDEFPLSDQCNILLRPLSSLTKPIEHNGSKFTPIYELGELALKKLPEGFDSLEDATKWVSISVYVGVDELMYWLFEWLCEHHFDVFGLIDRSLALPIDGKEVENV